ncbi:gustatory receptor for bitter taste 22e-like [Drosophila willistoni]|uniref:gustatory receptor for bitter taste 22e-like n=1 Tax=Drosophila willistoni TaxID=7260 RepID=UPI000C26C84E|nr:gustatory receptor for bitter taste 22e-like [Drosophila willistoni]
MYRTDQRMFHCRQSFRQKFVHFVQRTTLCSSWAMGLFPFTYNDGSRKWIRSKWLIGYGLLLNSGLIWLMISSDSNTISAEHYNLVTCRNFDSLVLNKGFSVLMQFSSMWLLLLSMTSNYSLIALVAVISLSLTGTTILLLSMNYHIAVATIYRLVWLINGKLLELVNRLRSGQTVNSVEIDLLLFLYNRLLSLNTRLAGIYDLQMTMVMVTFLTANIISIFFMIVYSITLKNTMSLPMYLVLGHAWLVNFWDFWLSIVICELAERTGKQTSVILKLFSDCDNIDTDLERSINDFALYCTHSRLRFRHCGMFYVNKESGFHMIVTSILYLLWLVQFDFKNL